MGDGKDGGVQVRDVMTSEVHAVQAGTSVRETARAMRNRGHGCVIVTRGYLAVGIVTERDIVHKVIGEGADPSKVLVDDIMSRPLITIMPDATIQEAAQRMSEYGIRRIVVVDGSGKLLGLLTAGGIARWLSKRADYLDPTLNAIARLKTPPPEGPYR